MVNKRINISPDDDDKLDKIINSLNDISSIPDIPIEDVKKEPTIVDEYLELLRLRRQIAYMVFKNYLLKLIKANADPQIIKETMAVIGMYLGIGDRWSNEVLKNAVLIETTLFNSIGHECTPVTKKFR